MRLRALHIGRLPGIRPGFTLDRLGPGVNVIVGPNASGKTSLLRALRAALYREELPGAGVDVEAELEAGGTRLHAVRVGPDLHWTREGQRADPPPLPDRRFLPCYTLHIEDLITPDHATDAGIAERLGRELAGGYDIRALLDNPPFKLKRTHGRDEAGALNAARKALRERQQAYHALRADEARLADLRERKEAADAAAGEADLHQRALELLEARRERRTLEARREAFPEGMDRLRGDELDALAKQAEQRREHAAEQEAAGRRRAEAQTALADSGLDGTDLDEGALGDVRRSVQRLQELEARLDQRAAERAQAEAALHTAVSELGGEPDRSAGLPIGTPRSGARRGGATDRQESRSGHREAMPEGCRPWMACIKDGAHQKPAALAPERVREMEQALEEKRRLDARVGRLDDALQALPAEAGEAPDPAPLRTARDELIHWLQAPRTPAWTGLRVAAAVALFGAAVAGIATAALLHGAFAALLLPLGWGGYVLLRPGDGDGRRREARERFRRTGVPEPAAWERTAVEARLGELDGEYQAAERRAREAEEHGRLERELAAARDALEAERGRLATVATEAGWDPAVLDASLERWVHLSHRYDEARERAQAARDGHAAVAEEARQVRDEITAFLRRFGEAPAAATADAGALSDRVERLAARLRRRDETRRAIAEAEREAERAGAAIAAVDREVAAVYTGAGLPQDDEPALRQRLERLDEWRQLEGELRDAGVRERERAAQLEGRDDLLERVEAGDETGLREGMERLRARASERDALFREIERIRHEVERAGHERALEAARAEAQQAEDALRDRLEEALFATAGSHLVRHVEAEHVQASQPAALRRAREWFGRFTHHQWDLAFDGDQGFAAKETASGERRALDQLSSGTRMQLLLAVRVAFALEAERGREPLPLALDEALTTADPERFRAAAEALRLLAAEDGRQVFYLTAQPDDARFWAAADGAVRSTVPPGVERGARGAPEGCEPGTVRIIDLAAVRRQEAAITEPGRLAPPERPAVPDPAGHGAEAYAVALGVPPVAPWADAGDIHLFHLLRDDLDLLKRLLELGVDRLGPLNALLDSDAAQAALGEAERQRLRARAAGAAAWLEAWRHGRGRPVDRAALEDSGAVSATFLERVTELNDRLGGDARALIDGLAAGEVRGFRTDKREQLEEWLSERGHLDPREPLTPAEVELRVRAAVQPHAEDPAGEARRLVDGLAAGAGAG